MNKEERNELDTSIVDKMKKYDGLENHGAIFMSVTFDKKTNKPDICTAIFCDDPTKLTQMIYNLIHMSDEARKSVNDALDQYKKDTN